MPHVYPLPTRVCSLQDNDTPLTLAARYNPSPAIVEALLKGKANIEATNNVRHLEDSRCATCILTAHSCVFVAG